jgi:hypothetical protein
MIGKDILSLWTDESEKTKKLKADFSMVMEVLGCVLRKCQGIQTSGEELNQANQILKALLEEYKVPPIALCVERESQAPNCFRRSNLILRLSPPVLMFKTVR